MKINNLTDKIKKLDKINIDILKKDIDNLYVDKELK